MRNVFAGLSVSVGLFCGVTLSQEVQPRPQPAQPPVAGQRQPIQPGQLQPGQVQPGQPAQPGAQPGRFTQPGQVVPGQQVIPGQAGQIAQRGTADQQIAACVFIACRNEIETAKLAEQKAQSNEVREFAQKMIDEHTPGCQEMQRLAGELVADRSRLPGGEAAGRAPVVGGNLDWVSIHEQIGEQCLATVKKELSAKQGTDFDQCFMGEQIGAHLHVIDSLKVLKEHASGDLRQKLEQELQTAQQHLQLAKQIDQRLKERPSERVSRRPEGNK